MAKGNEARRRPTSKDVAALAGVAQSTVSHVINGNYPVSDAVRRQVIDAMERLDYHPNASARTLRTSRTRTIALLENMDENTAGYDVLPYLSGIIRRAREHDYDVIVNTLADDDNALDRLSQRMICDGFVIMDVVEHDPRVERAAQLAVPAVLVGNAAVPGAGRIPDCVYYDYDAAMADIAREAAGCGCDTLVMVRDKPDDGRSLPLVERTMYASGRREAERLGLRVELIVPTAEGEDGVAAVGGELAAAIAGRRAVIAMRGVDLGDMVRRWCVAHDIRPGSDAAIVAIGPVAAQGRYPELSYLSTRPNAVVSTAVDLLVARIDGDASPTVVRAIAPERIIHRGTTLPMMAADADADAGA
ncbi:LacI family DNA-binding transcriptional regulator [Bifidobacterium sp. 82T10]|uniref:LacI family DNA-binding transcriptional regulator n=1 Tax=Bifidobacterium miconis TaxID=2834435 RepID=A0ABS6WED4_9BIFI|nr:LacI family DNA-binding transcriptional regulator [Bifidobacterium miconis]MBW3092411.1 LacI family DNA-binding transcriptional regulator [Bifidobacterium miconis]